MAVTFDEAIAEDHATTCGGTGWLLVGDVEFKCYGCPDCDFEWYRDEDEREDCPF